MEDVSRTVRGAWTVAVVRIQYFSFGSRGGDRIKRCRKMKWRQRARLDSMRRRRADVVTSVGGEATPRWGKGGHEANWTDTNLTGPKNKKNQYGRFSCYKWIVKI
jgi:hypothetical protein